MLFISDTAYKNNFIFEEDKIKIYNKTLKLLEK